MEQCKMKKKNVRITTIILTVLLAVTLTSCGEKDFICGWCTRSVHEKPHEARILGQLNKSRDKGLKVQIANEKMNF